MWQRALIRLALVIAPRAAVTMVGVGEVVDYGSTFHDLRGQLPARHDVSYAKRKLSDVQGVILHHSATKGQTINSIASFHSEVRGWPGIGYCFAIGWDGVVYQLHDVETISYHAQGYNKHSIGVVLIGNYHERDLTPEMEESLVMLVEYLRDKYGLKYFWLHRDCKPTICPGNYAADFIRPLQFGPLP